MSAILVLFAAPQKRGEELAYRNIATTMTEILFLLHVLFLSCALAMASLQPMGPLCTIHVIHIVA